MKVKVCILLLALCGAIGLLSLKAADPGIEAVLRKAYECVLKGDRAGVLACCHPEIRQFKGSFDSGYSQGRSGSLGELPMLAMGVTDGEKLTFKNLSIEVVREEGERAIAWVRYQAISERPSSLEMTKGETVRDQWDAQDYVILKKHQGQWRLRRLEDRAGHWLDVSLQEQSSDPFGGVK
jgi:hypothetical protein